MKRKNGSSEPQGDASPKEGKSRTYRVDLRRKAQGSLDKLPEGDFDAVLSAVQDLANSPRPKGVEKIKAAGLWRVRQGDYRVVYDIDDKQKVVTVVRIGHRREVYRSI